MTTIGTLQRVSAASLSKILLGAQDAVAAGDPTIAVIDVRDDDYIGGHIKGSQNVPSRSLDAMLPTLVRQLQDKETVVFHCALSQQRGPSAALRYLRERERLLASRKAREEDRAVPAGEEEEGKSAAAAEETGPKEQKVLVLDRGFVGWQELYGTDERLTEGYRKELWEDGYWG
ncbi:Rhodanese-like protein [Parathielavia hyrcaniae]|uniref:Rhodanese-like protein n=1 Tax=Parathielavia hyrcaniae TaxID=113614 RepID=A0AAN6PPS9_9PEZI|nr:Rhodanese-like protein [Parathielavia hyrcaniae]KAK4095730.1 Rhodanese-like protein [Parathielavia hyrcaniae]